MCSKHQQELMTESNPIDRIVPHSDKSYKGMSRENLPHRLNTVHSCRGIQPHLFERARLPREWSSSGRVSCFVSACAAEIRFLSLWFHFAVVTAPIVF